MNNLLYRKYRNRTYQHFIIYFFQRTLKYTLQYSHQKVVHTHSILLLLLQYSHVAGRCVLAVKQSLGSHPFHRQPPVGGLAVVVAVRDRTRQTIVGHLEHAARRHQHVTRGQITVDDLQPKGVKGQGQRL